MSRMSVVEPLVEPSTSDDDSLDHLYCCNPNLAHCGADISDATESDFALTDPSACVVCVDLDRQPCLRCGLYGMANPDGSAA